MATFIITYDAHLARNYADLYRAMEIHDAVRLNESVWGIEMNCTVDEAREWTRQLLDDDDTIVVIQIAPKPSWASRHTPANANAWMRAHISA